MANLLRGRGSHDYSAMFLGKVEHSKTAVFPVSSSVRCRAVQDREPHGSVVSFDQFNGTIFGCRVSKPRSLGFPFLVTSLS